MTPRVGAVARDELSTEPVIEGGANFRSFGLRSAGPRRLELVPSLGTRALQIGFLLAGGASFVAAAVFLGRSEFTGFALALLIGAGLAGAGLLLRRYGRPFVLDRASGRWWRGGRRPPAKKGEGSGRLSEVRAIQILHKVVRSNDHDDEDFDCYELNLVLDAGARVNMCAHADIASLRTDSVRIARLIGVELIDQA